MNLFSLQLLLILFTTQPSRVKISGTLLEKESTLTKAVELTLKNSKNWETEVKDVLTDLKYSIARWEISGDTLIIKVVPQYVIRHVFIRGNWPLFETDIMRRIILRPGTPLPGPGKKRQELFESQTGRIEDYLHREGYFDSKIKITLKGKKNSYTQDLIITLNKGSSYKLGKLTVKGNSHVKSSVIEKFFRHSILFYERPFYKRQFRQDRKKLVQYYRKLGFYAVSVRDNFDKLYSLDRKKRTVNITLQIRERRKVEVRFENRAKASLRELQEKLTFLESGTYDEHEIERSAKAIQHHYQTKGFFNAAVFAESHLLGSSGLKVIYHIQVGQEHRVGSISVKGTKHFSVSKIRSTIATKVFPKKLAFFGLGSGGFITPKQLKQDVERIEGLYREAGFQDTKVTLKVLYPKMKYAAGAASINAAEPRTGGNVYVTVVFTITEGRRVLVSGMNFKGISSAVAQRLAKMSKVKKGVPFSKEAISNDLKTYARFFANMGYPYHSITTEMNPDNKKQGVMISYTITMNKRVRFGPTFFRGNFKTRRSVVWGEIPFKEGDVFSLSKIEEAGRNLRSLGIFRSVRIRFLGLEKQKEVLPVVVELIERYDDWGEMEIGGGFSTDNLYFASLSYKNKNIFGFAKSIEFKGEAGAEILSGTVTYQDSRFLGTNLLFQIMGYGRSEETVRLGDILTYGSSVTLKKSWSQRFQWFLRYEIRHVAYKENLYRVSSGAGESSKVDFSTTTASFGPAVVLDRRNNPLVPSKGYRLSSSVRLASRYLGGDDDFIHFNMAGQVFFRLPLGLVLAQGLRYDHGIPIGNTNSLPKVERFFAGGDTTVRGYEEDRLFAQMVQTPMNPVGGLYVYNLSPLGGNIRFISNTELQFPIWKHSPLLGMPIWGALFFDSGYIVNTYSQFESSTFHSGYGGALRLVTPVGVISFEYGIPLNRVWNTDPNGRFHFNFGFIF
ncbi:outer membrane protein assembly factor BamA [Myxococcota bacterium]|nr:outer membrane protein assembly factor BamA [Myxococcota bacterium]MBU1536522.1 outer membrane protein assembly factor BamA [Myxococcota bacterium]